MTEPTIVALIPARGGSKRIPRKNLREFAGRPLIFWTILAAQQSGVFGDEIYVSTEDAEIKAVAEVLGAKVIDRPAEYAADLAPDILWVQHALKSVGCIAWTEHGPTAFAILRPTSPFRSAETIRAAWDHLKAHGSAAVDSLRAVEPAKQHPFKMWEPHGALIQPHNNLGTQTGTPVHSMPTQAFPTVLAQTAALEMAWSRVALGDRPTISGTMVLPWTMNGWEGWDLNTESDWLFAEFLLEHGLVTLPELVGA